MAAKEPLDRRDAGALPRISVIVPSYNQGEFLRECLESIFRQDYPHLEVVVMDGGSTDSSVEIIRSFAPRLNYWQSQPDGGQSAAINAGMQHCTGDLVSWLNSDDLYCDDGLWVMARAWMQHPGRGLYIANGFRQDQATGTRKPFLDRHVCLNRRGLLEGADYILQPATFFLRDAFHAVGGLDPKLHFCMDWDIYLGISQRYPVVAINEFVAVSREYQDTKTRSGGLGRITEIARMIQSHSGKDLTPGTFCYILESTYNMVRNDLSGEAVGAVHNGLVKVLADLGDAYGDGAWCAGYADPQDDTYLPFAGGPGLDRPRRAGAPPLPRISVVIVVEEQDAGLPDTLASILAQDYPDLEMLIVDGAGSVDADHEAAATGARLLRPGRNMGQAALVNHGLAAAQGEVLTWVPAGDLLADGALHAAGAAFADDPELDIVFGNALFIDPQGEPCVVDIKPMRSAFWFGRFEPPRGQPAYDAAAYSVPQASVCFRRRTWEQAGPLNESYRHIHAYEWFLRVAARGRRGKLERTQAFCRVGARDEPRRWYETLVEVYRFSRSQWPGPSAPEYEEVLDRYCNYFLHHKFGTAIEEEPTSWRHRFVRLVTHLRLFNPERCWPRNFTVPPCGAPPFQVPLPEPTIRRLMPLRSLDDLPRREGTAYLAAVCLPRVPRHPGVLGTEARELHLLAEVHRCSVVELFTFRSPGTSTSAVPADVVYTPEQRARFQLDVYWRGLPQRSVVLRFVDALRGLGIPVLGPANPLHISRQLVRVRGYCSVPLQERLERKVNRPDFLFVGDQGNPAALALETCDTATRLVLIAHGPEADRMQREVASSWGLSRLASALEARRGRRYEAANLVHFDGIIAATESDRALFAAQYGFAAHRIFVTGRTVDAEWWGACPHLPATPVDVAFLGNLDDRQDASAAARLARRIMPLLRQQTPEVVCWIIDVGSASGKRRSTLGAARVIAAEDARQHLAEAAVVCLPHAGGKPGRSAAAEVLAAGVPLVASAAATENLAVASGVHYLAAEEDHEVAAAIASLLRTPDAAALLACAGQEQIQQFHNAAVQLAGLRGWLDQLARLPRRRHDSGVAPQGVPPSGGATEQAAA
jgi:glycosyltransferase involved in cell wall biosynthesis